MAGQSPIFYKTAVTAQNQNARVNTPSSRALRALLAYLAAGVAGYIVATLFATCANLINLAEVGARIGAGDAVRTFLFDLWGMAPRFDWPTTAT